MKHYFLFFLLCTCLCIFIPTASTIKEAKSENDDSSFINSYEEDLTGDGLREYVTLNGVLLTDKSDYYRDVWLDITSPFSHQWKISFEGGYDPHLQLIDFNHDHTFDMFYEVAKDEDKRHNFYQLYTLKNGEVEQLPLPKNNHIRGEFVKNFQVELNMHPNKKPMQINIKDKKDDYVQEEIYDENGKLLKKQQINISPITFMEPILISETKGYGLKSYQSVKGTNQNDLFGEIVTLWYYKNDKWVALKSDWRENSS